MRHDAVVRTRLLCVVCPKVEVIEFRRRAAVGDPGLSHRPGAMLLSTDFSHRIRATGNLRPALESNRTPGWKAEA